MANDDGIQVRFTFLNRKDSKQVLPNLNSTILVAFQLQVDAFRVIGFCAQDMQP